MKKLAEAIHALAEATAMQAAATLALASEDSRANDLAAAHLENENAAREMAEKQLQIAEQFARVQADSAAAGHEMVSLFRRAEERAFGEGDES